MGKEKRNFRKTAASGVTWMLGSSVCLKVTSLAVNIVLARLLVPSDFGAVALALGFTGILQTFAEMGTSVAIVQMDSVTPSTLDSAFTTTLVTTLIIGTSLWVSASFIADFFSMPVVKNLLRIAAVAYFFRGLFALQRCLLLREFHYKKIAFLDFLGYALYGFTATVLAIYGFGAYSMAWAQLVWTMGLLTAGSVVTGYFPKGLGNWKEMRYLVRFGSWVSLSRIIRNLGGNVDRFVIGKAIDANALGVYSLAQRFVTIAPDSFSRIIDQVMLPVYSKFKNDPNRIENGYWEALSYSSIILLPPIFLLFLLAKPIVLLVLGEKWHMVVPVIRIMSLYAMTRALGEGIFDSVVFASGRPHIVTVVSIFRLIVFPFCLIVGAYWGLIGITWGFAVFGVLARLFSQFLLHKFFNFSFFRFFREISPAFLCAMVAAIPCLVISSNYNFTNNIWLTLFIIISNSFLWLGLYGLCGQFFMSEKINFLFEQSKHFLLARKPT
ncbi:polysaccharide biosynthesis protein [delta proteobacterium NaphS2]|nr:polysaccharide biosynthesis protein [delta proteobacterium NaphS2]